MKYYLAFLAMLATPLSGIAIDIYVPSLPAISDYFGVPKEYIQSTITTYMIGLGVGQLVAGSLSDSYGRRTLYFFGLVIFIIATFAVTIANDIYLLLFLRFIQGITIAAVVVPMRALLADLFTGQELTKMMTYMTIAWSIGPIIAPAIGGYLQYYFGWRASFYFLDIYCLILLCLAIVFMHETIQYRHSFDIKSIFARYRLILSHPLYLLGMIINGTLYAVILLFSVVAPFLIQDVMHYSAVQFGHISLLMGLAWFLGSLIAGFSLHVPLMTKMFYVLSGMLLTSLVMLIIALLVPLNIYNIIIPIWIMFLFGGMIYSPYFARSAAIFPKIAGSATALISSAVFMFGALAAGFATFLKANSEVPLACGYMVVVSILIILYFIDRVLVTVYSAEPV